MQVFRDTARPIIFIVAISFFAWLVFDLSGLTGGTGLLTETSVGKVNGRSVDIRLYQERVNQVTQARQQQSALPLGLAELAQIRDQVWEQFIQERILEEEYRRWRISVTPEEIAAAIRSSPPVDFYTLELFQTDGEFDITRYERWLASAEGQALIPNLEAQYRTSLLQAKLARHLVSSLAVSDAALWERFRDEYEQARVGLVEIDPASAVRDLSVTVTPTEVEEYYRANRDQFQRQEEAWLSFLVMDRRPIASDTAAAREAARRLRDEILGGVPFEEVARRESADTVSGNRGGDLGEWVRGQFAAPFDSAAFALPLGTVSEPVLTQFGYHLIEVTARRGDTASGRHILIPIEPTGAHRDQLDARADSLERLAADRLDPAALDTAARVLGLPIQRTGPVVRNSPVGVLPDAAVWARQARVGEHSPVIETPGEFYVFRLDSIRPAGVAPLAEVRGFIEARLRDQKKLVQARTLARQVQQQAVQSGGALQEAARAMGFDYLPLGPFTRIGAPLESGEAIGAAFTLAPGQVSHVIEAEGALLILQGLGRIPADSSDFVQRLPVLREQATEQLRSLYLQQYLAALRNRARIVDHRDRIFRTAAQLEAGF
jgi:peptidyl-prolyl cis-trans isomerase D